MLFYGNLILICLASLLCVSQQKSTLEPEDDFEDFSIISKNCSCPDISMPPYLNKSEAEQKRIIFFLYKDKQTNQVYICMTNKKIQQTIPECKIIPSDVYVDDEVAADLLFDEGFNTVPWKILDSGDKLVTKHVPDQPLHVLAKENKNNYQHTNMPLHSDYDKYEQLKELSFVNKPTLVPIETDYVDNDQFIAHPKHIIPNLEIANLVKHSFADEPQKKILIIKWPQQSSETNVDSDYDISIEYNKPKLQTNERPIFDYNAEYSSFEELPSVNKDVDFITPKDLPSSTTSKPVTKKLKHSKYLPMKDMKETNMYIIPGKTTPPVAYIEIEKNNSSNTAQLKSVQTDYEDLTFQEITIDNTNNKTTNIAEKNILDKNETVHVDYTPYTEFSMDKSDHTYDISLPVLNPEVIHYTFTSELPIGKQIESLHYDFGDGSPHELISVVHPELEPIVAEHVDDKPTNMFKPELVLSNTENSVNLPHKDFLLTDTPQMVPVNFVSVEEIPLDTDNSLTNELLSNVKPQFEPEKTKHIENIPLKGFASFTDIINIPREEFLQIVHPELVPVNPENINSKSTNLFQPTIKPEIVSTKADNKEFVPVNKFRADNETEPINNFIENEPLKELPYLNPIIDSIMHPKLEKNDGKSTNIFQPTVKPEVVLIQKDNVDFLSVNEFPTNNETEYQQINNFIESYLLKELLKDMQPVREPVNSEHVDGKSTNIFQPTIKLEIVPIKTDNDFVTIYEFLTDNETEPINNFIKTETVEELPHSNPIIELTTHPEIEEVKSEHNVGKSTNIFQPTVKPEIIPFKTDNINFVSLNKVPADNKPEYQFNELPSIIRPQVIPVRTEHIKNLSPSELPSADTPQIYPAIFASFDVIPTDIDKSPPNKLPSIVKPQFEQEKTKHIENLPQKEHSLTNLPQLPHIVSTGKNNSDFLSVYEFPIDSETENQPKTNFIEKELPYLNPIMDHDPELAPVKSEHEDGKSTNTFQPIVKPENKPSKTELIENLPQKEYSLTSLTQIVPFEKYNTGFLSVNEFPTGNENIQQPTILTPFEIEQLKETILNTAPNLVTDDTNLDKLLQSQPFASINTPQIRQIDPVETYVSPNAIPSIVTSDLVPIKTQHFNNVPPKIYSWQFLENHLPLLNNEYQYSQPNKLHHFPKHNQVKVDSHMPSISKHILYNENQFQETSYYQFKEIPKESVANKNIPLEYVQRYYVPTKTTALDCSRQHVYQQKERTNLLIINCDGKRFPLSIIVNNQNLPCINIVVLNLEDFKKILPDFLIVMFNLRNDYEKYLLNKDIVLSVLKLHQEDYPYFWNKEIQGRDKKECDQKRLALVVHGKDIVDYDLVDDHERVEIAGQSVPDHAENSSIK